MIVFVKVDDVNLSHSDAQDSEKTGAEQEGLVPNTLHDQWSAIKV